MKTRIMIIEDNYYKSISTRFLLECQLKVDVDVTKAPSQRDVAALVEEFKPDMCLCRPQGSVTELLAKFKKRNTNRRNTEITLVLTSDLGDVPFDEISPTGRRKPRKSFASAA